MLSIDLRSDTVTRPTPAMRNAMRDAEVGDDVYGEDPTVNRLENLAAELTGMEASLLMPSGTMSNLVALRTHCRAGDQVILGERSHIFVYETGGVSGAAGLFPLSLPNEPNGAIALTSITAAVHPFNVHYPVTRLLCLENTHNSCGGRVMSHQETAGYIELARSLGLLVHIDGARIFNAAAALGTPVSALVAGADSVSFCLSKGLGAPVGSLLCGSRPFIAEARRQRKLLGGGMRQAGVIAAAGLVALTTMVTRLVDDHAMARLFAERLADVKGATVRTADVETNIVVFDADARFGDLESLIAELRDDGVLLSTAEDTTGVHLRAVTHYEITEQDVLKAADLISRRLLTA